MSQNFLDKLFIKARSHYSWKKKDIDERILENLYELVKNCPTSANSEPMRIVFLKSKESKERIKPYLSEGNVENIQINPSNKVYLLDFDQGRFSEPSRQLSNANLARLKRSIAKLMRVKQKPFPQSGWEQLMINFSQD